MTTLSLAAAGQLLDLGARIGNARRAQEQLEGAVALHHLLERHRVAYLADEVGMGKTYVALATLALFRHLDPRFRVCVIAPRKNIQKKWHDELGNLVHNNFRFPDLRTKGLDGRPARPRVLCENLVELVREATVDKDRDFFCRLSSFSLGLSDEEGAKRSLRDRLKAAVPWAAQLLSVRSSHGAFKEDFARTVCCVLPQFDLVIVDEAHNLRGGYVADAAARNRVLALAFGHPRGAPKERGRFPEYGPRAARVLFLSATPLEDDLRHLYNQLDVFGLADEFAALKEPGVDQKEKRELAARIMIRRVTAIEVAGDRRTKNRYRREWRHGGVKAHDEPFDTPGVRDRLAIALVQKKVSELLAHERFNAQFQIGMLASFESFMETAVRTSETAESNFDDPEQAENDDEREGIDIRTVNRLARDHRERFDAELPHPKMDGLIETLSDAWRTGRKSLVFVRRVASVGELKRKLDDRYDTWLLARLRAELPEAVRPTLEEQYAEYRRRRAAIGSRELVAQPQELPGDAGEQRGSSATKLIDKGGNDTFFAWFFRGDGPDRVLSGAAIQQRFTQRGSVHSTFFADNHVMWLLGASHGTVASRLAEVIGIDPDELKNELRSRAGRFLSTAKTYGRGDIFEAFQGAAVELLTERATGNLHERARVVLRHRYAASGGATRRVPEMGEYLELVTFFTELRGREDLRQAIWPSPHGDDFERQFLEQERRAALLAAIARLGHAFIDLYVVTIDRLGTLAEGDRNALDKERGTTDKERAEAYLNRLDRQRLQPLTERDWGAYDELAAASESFHLICDVNAREARDRPVGELAQEFGGLLREQQPVGGMSGRVNQTLVRQFRMPGYPFVLFTTDLLQEGEDLHTFCSAVYHYGIAWTPSAMEQRTGRIDRVLSQTERRLVGLDRPPASTELLQVYFPHLQGTVEVLQVQRVLTRMNTFLRLMHRGFEDPGRYDKKIDVGKELLCFAGYPPAITDDLRSAFPVEKRALEGGRAGLEHLPSAVEALRQRFRRLARCERLGGLRLSWDEDKSDGCLTGTAHLEDRGRQQPVALFLQSYGERLLVRCVSPVGRFGDLEGQASAVVDAIGVERIEVGAIPCRDERSYDLTVEDDVLLGAESADVARVGWLLRRVASQADDLERQCFPGADRPLDDFRDDLEMEDGHVI